MTKGWIASPCRSKVPRPLFSTKLPEDLIELSAGRSLKLIFSGRSLNAFFLVGGHAIQKELRELSDIAVTTLSFPSTIIVYVTGFLSTYVRIGADLSFIPAINNTHPWIQGRWKGKPHP